jgi:hypothetical protein
MNAVANHHGAARCGRADRTQELLALGLRDADRSVRSTENGTKAQRRSGAPRSAHASYEVESMQRHDRASRREKRQAQSRRDLAVDMEEFVPANAAHDDGETTGELQSRWAGARRQVGAPEPIARHAFEEIDVRLAATARMRKDVQD